MKILFLTQVLPYPLDAGPKVRAYHVLRYLAQRHQVTLVSFVRPGDPPAALAHLRALCGSVHTVPMVRSPGRDLFHLARSLAGPTPFLIARDWVPAMAQTLDRVVQAEGPFDAVHADQLWMAPYALGIAEQAHPPGSIRRVLDQHNAVFLIPGRMAAGEGNPLKRVLMALEARKLARYEAEVCARFDRVVWVTEDDRRAVQGQAARFGLQQAVAAADGSVIPICVDPEAEPPIPRGPDPRRVTFLGGLHYPPNAQGVLWFAREVFPQVLAQVPNAILTVMGKQPPAALARLGLPPGSLELTGYVDDPRPYLADTAAFIVPLLAGGGMRVKILDAWSWGLPVVSTTVGAEGIQLRAGEQLVLADEPGDFARAVVRCLQEPDYARQLAQAGRDWVLAHYHWRLRYRAWEAIYPAPQAEPVRSRVREPAGSQPVVRT
ncbi:glycosyltransferase family 4 protein [Litorilinea aerophila]|uniref:Glycosyltransferase n=1 Tax=Litorilinea aerophila TaxID=1204385 RepID=A0A540VFH5_9CHLR|nr:glycosyltransferase family 4 protein [Litorilinea aerophila]MCC9076798.1 glycosyltransferase family 4 protein [Litorilinea aerophila]